MGRAFLQEAHLIADYERGNFSLSQCQFISGLKPNIVTIPSLADEAASLPHPGSNHLSGGAIAGIVIAPILALPCIFFIFAYKKKVFIFKPAKPDPAELSSEEMERPDGADGTTAYEEAAAGTGTNTTTGGNPNSPELEGVLPKPLVEAMSKPVGAEMEASDLTGFYAPKMNRPEMADNSPAAAEMGGTDAEGGVHEMFDESVYRELGASGQAEGTTNTQARNPPAATTNSNRPFSYVETPLTAVQGHNFPAAQRQEALDENATWSTISSGFGSTLGPGAGTYASEKEPIEEEAEVMNEKQPEPESTQEQLQQQARLSGQSGTFMSSSSGPVPTFMEQHQEPLRTAPAVPAQPEGAGGGAESKPEEPEQLSEKQNAGEHP